MNFEFVYKICSKSEWLSAIQNGKFIGTKKDIEDGYIHFSNKNQIKRTLDKYFSKQKDLVLTNELYRLKLFVFPYNLLNNQSHIYISSERYVDLQIFLSVGCEKKQFH